MEFKDIRNFIEGNYNHLLSKFDLVPDNLKELADKRKKICEVCPKLQKNKCGECGCSYPEILWSEGKSCPLKKW